MKHHFTEIAQALIEEMEKQPDLAEKFIDAAVQLLDAAGQWRNRHAFLEACRCLCCARRNEVQVTVETPDDGVHTAEAVKDVLEAALGTNIILSHRKDPALLGGLRVQYNDDRFDFSLRSSLAHAAADLTTHFSF